LSPDAFHKAVSAGFLVGPSNENPDIALCGGPNMIPMAQVGALLRQLKGIQALVREG
jgi:3-deoxy-D-manno-octulosonic acid (KDO) 8-phosphate synthase